MSVRVNNANLGSARLLAVLLSVTLGVLLTTFSVLAWRKGSSAAKLPPRAIASPAAQIIAGAASSLNVATDRFPLAGRFRPRLGRRFLTHGKITTDLVGMLQRGQEKEPLRLTRSYSETGETVTFTLSGRSAVFQWRDDSGAWTDGARANADNRKLIERLTLDSPDQFVLAQLRRTAYRTIAEGVRPEELINSNANYTGPVWTLVQVLEAGAMADSRPLSALRQYYLNQKTGLLDRVLSQEDGQTITAELTGWVERNGETFPTVITWKSGGTEIMSLTVNNISFPARP